MLILPRACDHFLDVVDALIVVLGGRVDKVDGFPHILVVG